MFGRKPLPTLDLRSGTFVGLPAAVEERKPDKPQTLVPSTPVEPEGKESNQDLMFEKAANKELLEKYEHLQKELRMLKANVIRDKFVETPERKEMRKSDPFFVRIKDLLEEYEKRDRERAKEIMESFAKLQEKNQSIMSSIAGGDDVQQIVKSLGERAEKEIKVLQGTLTFEREKVATLSELASELDKQLRKEKVRVLQLEHELKKVKKQSFRAMGILPPKKAPVILPSILFSDDPALNLQRHMTETSIVSSPFLCY